jgi:hypothetical protein
VQDVSLSAHLRARTSVLDMVCQGQTTDSQQITRRLVSIPFQLSILSVTGQRPPRSDTHTPPTPQDSRHTEYQHQVRCALDNVSHSDMSGFSQSRTHRECERGPLLQHCATRQRHAAQSKSHNEEYPFQLRPQLHGERTTEGQAATRLHSLSIDRTCTEPAGRRASLCVQ